MAHTREPNKEMMALQDQMSRLFQGPVDREGEGGDFDSTSWNPPVDIYETRDDIIVNVEVPGIFKDLISVEVKDEVLIIQGERPFEKDVSWAYQGMFLKMRSRRPTGALRGNTIPMSILTTRKPNPASRS